MMPSLDPFREQGAVDLTAFLGTWPWRLQASADRAALSAYADRLNLSRVCVSHLASVFGFDTRSGNEELLKAVTADERMLAFGVVNPVAADAASELRLLIDAGCRGIRLFPGYHGYFPSDPAAIALLDAASAAGLTVQLFTRLDDERLRHPRFSAPDVTVHEVAGIVRTFPGKLILSGLRMQDWDAVHAQLDADTDLSGLLLDLWFVNGPALVIPGLCAAGRAGRFAYGSGYPVQTAEATALQLATADIAPAERYALCRGNAERML